MLKQIQGIVGNKYVRRVGECTQKGRNDKTITSTFDVGSGIYIGTFWCCIYRIYDNCCVLMKFFLYIKIRSEIMGNDYPTLGRLQWLFTWLESRMR